jgi:hypothetical protein
MENKPAEWDWLTFLSNWHEKEYERRYTLENVVATPIGLLTGAYAIIYLLLTQYDFKHNSLLAICCFALPLVLSLGFSFAAAYYVYKSYAVVKSKVYRGLPEANALRQHMNDLVTHYKEFEPHTDATQKFKEYFIELLADQITTNVVNNDERTRNIQQAKQPLMICFLALFLVLPSFLYNQLTKPDPVYQVTLTPVNTSTMAQEPKLIPSSPPPPPKERQIQQIPKPKRSSR